MKYDLQLLVLFIIVGLRSQKLTFKGWFGIGMVILAWIMFNWLKG